MKFNQIPLTLQLQAPKIRANGNMHPENFGEVWAKSFREHPVMQSLQAQATIGMADTLDAMGQSVTGRFSGKAEQVANKPKHLLEQANDLINGNRQTEYGEVRQNHAQIASAWFAMLSHKMMPGQVITPEDVVHCMISLKLVRLAKTPDHVDSQLDVAGYIGCEANIQSARVNGIPLLGATIDHRDLGKK